MTTDTHPKPDPELLGCPFCGMRPAEDLIDTLYPTAKWRDDDGLRHYMPIGANEEAHGHVWSMHCTENMGGCGATIRGDSRDEAIAAWNRRSSSIPAGDVGKVVEALSRDIMNLPCRLSVRTDPDNVRWYESGHKAARHAAVELVSAALACLRGAALLPQMTTWQPMETAPKDGSVLLVNDTAHGGYTLARWLGSPEWSGWVYDDDIQSDNNPLGPKPTHWQAITPSPTTPPGLEGDSQKDANHG